MTTPSQSLRHIAVIIVNYGTPDLAIRAVNSVLTRAHGGRQIEVHLVDNASPGDDAAQFRAAAPDWGDRVTLWLEDDNHGFGRGNNVVLNALAARDVPPDAAFLLNPDASLHNEAVDSLASALEADPSAGAVGAAVLREDLTPAVAAFRFPGCVSELARILSFGVFDRLTKSSQVALSPTQPTGPVDWVSGAAVMLRFAPAAKIGFFDPGFFLYYEEVDLMRRLQAAGNHVLYVPQAQVLHAEGAATGQFAGKAARARDPWYLYQSWAHYFTRAYGRPRALALACALWPMALLNIAHRGLRGKAPTLPRRFFRDHATHVIWPLLQPLLRGQKSS